MKDNYGLDFIELNVVVRTLIDFYIQSERNRVMYSSKTVSTLLQHNQCRLRAAVIASEHAEFKRPFYHHTYIICI